MRTHGHTEGNITHWGLWWEPGAGDYERDNGEWGGWEGIILGEIPDMGDGGMETANHYGTCIPM